MAGSGAESLKEYLKRYESSNAEEEEKKRKKKMRKSKKTKPGTASSGVLVVDEDPIWQKPVKVDEEEDNDSPDEEKPIVDEDIEVKRMRRLELLRARRPYNAIAEDGSGWVTLSPKHKSDVEPSLDMSPPRRGRARNDSLSSEPNRKHLGLSLDMSPPRRGRTYNDSPSPEPERKHSGPSLDISPPRRGRTCNDSPSPEPQRKRLHSGGMDADLSPPRQHRLRHHTPSRCLPHGSTIKVEGGYTRDESADMSPPRRHHQSSPDQDEARALPGTNLSPPRKSRRVVERSGSDDLSPPRLARRSIEKGSSRASFDQDISPPRKNRKEATVLASSKERPKTGLISGRDMREEIARTKMDDLLRFEQMDPSMSGRGAEAIYRDKKGNRISKDEYMKLNQKVEEKPKEKKIEWGKGLAQKREAEARLLELESEKDKPFARTRDDPELDEMLKERVRWGDPMAHLVKKKHSEAILPNLGEGEKMKESGFIIPQDIPSHSWLKRGLDAAPNRYGIKPGRHWDGVDRSNGFEKQFFKRMNEKQATEREAYLWSVSDM